MLAQSPSSPDAEGGEHGKPWQEVALHQMDALLYQEGRAHAGERSRGRHHGR